MNTRRLPIGLLAKALGLVIVLAFAVRAMRSVGAREQELRSWQANVESARRAQSDLDQFGQQEEAFARREQELLAAIPLNEQEPFALIKQLTRVAEGVGAANLSVSLKPTVLAPQPSVGSPAPPAGMTAVPIQMEFELELAPLLELLTRLRSLQRFTTIEELRVARSEAILPRQQVTLVLNAYTLTSP